MDDSRNPQNEIASTIRVIDANRNRAVEAARVIEEFCRFHLESTSLASWCKEIRHAISATASEILNTLPCSALPLRETDQDVGIRIQAIDESDRSSLDDVVAANFSRLQESLRSLEEYGKVLSPDFGARFESIRYETYQLQKSLFHLGRAHERLTNCRICVLTDAAAAVSEFEQRIGMLVEAGVDMIQLREKNMDSGDLLERARLMQRLSSGSGTIFIVNDRPDICVLSGADGVHVGQTDLSVKEARKIVGEKLVGVSTHSLAQAKQAVRDGADYIGIGPIFQSHTKLFDELPGCKLLKEISSAVSIPGFAIGGIDESNIQQVIDSGGSRVAMSAGILDASNPARVVEQVIKELSRKL